MGIAEAFGQGFASFYSIWQVCILQISPFFMAYVIGLYFAGLNFSNTGEHGYSGLGARVFLPALAFAPGFAVPYALLSLSSLPVGRILAYNLGILGFIAGIYILSVSLVLLISGRAAFIDDFLKRPIILSGVSLLLGVSFALIYSPCITPALSDILGMTSRSETAVRGGVLALFYSLGICLGLTVTSGVLVLVLRRFDFVVRNSKTVKDACGLVLAALGVLNVSGLMVYYKAFFLGLLVQ